jgi:uncharacterized protein (DUF486 family)
MRSTFLRTAGLLIVSNTFMTFAWYAHLRNLSDRKWYIAAVLSWGIAFFEYMFMVPANRIGSTEMSLAQLKILQEVITLTVFVPFVVLYMRQPLRLDFSGRRCAFSGPSSSCFARTGYPERSTLHLSFVS